MELQGAVTYFTSFLLRQGIASFSCLGILCRSFAVFSGVILSQIQDNHHLRRQRTEGSSHILSDCSVDVVKESDGYFALFLVKRRVECSEILECSEVLAHTRYWNVLFCCQVIHSLAFSLTSMNGNQSD